MYTCFVYMCETERKSTYLETKKIYIYVFNPENEHRITIQLENVDAQRWKEHASQCVYNAAKLCLDLRKNKTKTKIWQEQAKKKKGAKWSQSKLKKLKRNYRKSRK